MQLTPREYPQILAKLKVSIRQSRLKASLSVNAEMLMLYWQIGKTIIEQQEAASWGAKIIDQLASGLRKEFPDMQGLSPRNLKYMRQFAAAYPDRTFVQAALAQITWYHHITLLTKVKEPEERHFYIQETAIQGWSRDVMVAQIETGYYRRKGYALTNFNKTLPDPMSDLAKYITKDPYVFDFLTLADEHNEKDLEDALTDHITKFLLELGTGFAYVGRQFHVEVGKQDFFIDLLFYHVKLHAYVVIELKRGKFMPEYVGKLNFYLSVIDDKLKSEVDQPSIGILICQSKDKVVAEYALRDITKPIGISSYKLTESIPENLKGKLPSIKELEKELGALANPDDKDD